MYNRYTPQPDGSYHKNRLPDPQPPNPQSRKTSQQKEPEQNHEEKQDIQPDEQPIKSVHHTSHEKINSAGSFLRNLLPKDFDTGDLLIVLLLLLMAGDKDENHNNALLTLALYFFI